MLPAEIRQLAAERLAGTIADRRLLHAHPNYPFQNRRHRHLSKHDWMRWVFRGKRWLEPAWSGRSKVVMLPTGWWRSGRYGCAAITELNTVDYASRNSGVMHACGHDAHTASLLATAGILQSLKDRWAGSVRLIFQPAEEKLPGGASGMIGDGVLRDPVPTAVIGQHVMPSVPSGKIAMRGGQLMASMDEISVTVHGKRRAWGDAAPAC